MPNATKCWYVQNSFYIRYARARYIALRLIYRMLYGKQRRNAILEERKIDFTNFIPEGVYRGKYYRAYIRKKTDDFVQLFHYREQSLQQYFYLSSLKPVYLDVGANVGRYVLQFARQYPNATCIAIEAHPRTFAALCRNIELNPDLADRILSFNYAASDTVGTARLYEKILNSGVFSTAHSSMIFEFDGKNVVEVQSNTLDNILSIDGSKYDNIDLIKIDVEGAELNVLKGALKILERTNRLIVETHGDNFEPVLNFMKTKRFEIQRVSFGNQIYLICRKLDT